MAAEDNADGDEVPDSDDDDGPRMDGFLSSSDDES
jgi:hypothetical protein